MGLLGIGLVLRCGGRYQASGWIWSSWANVQLWLVVDLFNEIKV